MKTTATVKRQSPQEAPNSNKTTQIKTATATTQLFKLMATKPNRKLRELQTADINHKLLRIPNFINIKRTTNFRDADYEFDGIIESEGVLGNDARRIRIFTFF